MPLFPFVAPGNKKARISDSPSDGDVIVFRTADDLYRSEAPAIGGEANTSSNSGAGDGWALAKVGVDLPFKSLITTAPLATTVNANDLTLTIDNIAETLLDVAVGAAGTVLTSNGVGAAPTYQAGGAGDMILANAQTNTGIKTFLDTTMKLRNVANTFDGFFVNTNTADRIYTLPDFAGTVILTAGAQSITGQKTFTAPILGTPASGTLTNCDGTAASLTAGNVTTNANMTGDVTSVGNAQTYALDSIVNADINSTAAIVETKYSVAVGASGTVLTSNGVGAAPTYQSGGAGDMILASAQTNSGIKTFLDTTMKLRNVANTFDGFFVNTNTADRIYTLPDAAGTVVITGLANQLTNTELTAGAFAKITGVGTIASGTWEGTAIASAFLDADTMHLSIAQTVNGAKTFLDTNMLLRNVANTFNGSFVNTNTADRIYTLPDSAGTVVLEALGQTLTNKTIDGDDNTIVDINETQMNVSVGAATTVLTSNGVGVAPSYAAPAGGEFTAAWTADHNQGGSTFGLRDALFVDPTITTKKIQMDLAGMTAAITATLDFNFTTAKTITFPDATTTVIGTGIANQITNTELTAGAFAKITGVGTIATGTWEGTTVAVLQGGTGVTTSTGTTNVVLSGSPTIVTPTVVSLTNMQHDHSNAAGGGTFTSLNLTDTATIAYLNTANVYTGTGNQNITATGRWQEGGTNITPIGLHDIWIPGGGHDLNYNGRSRGN